MQRDPLCSPLFPYTTLFRSHREGLVAIPVRDGDGTLLGIHGLHAARSSRTCRLDAGDRLPGGRSGSFWRREGDRKSTRLNSSHTVTSYAVFCLKKKKTKQAI